METSAKIVNEITSAEPVDGGGAPKPKALSRPVRDKIGRWVPGCPSPNPTGHPRGGGRIGALRIIDDLLEEHRNQETLKTAFQNMLDTDPIGFWRIIIQPLLPQRATLTMEQAETTLKIISGIDESKL